jgi:hypothetical protein
MTFHPNDAVRTHEGVGHIVHALPDGTYSVMINNHPKGRDTYSGEYFGKFTEKSPTVSKIYQEKEIEHL